MGQESDEIKPATLESWWLGLPAIGNALAILAWIRIPFLPSGTVYDKPGPFVFLIFISVGTLILSSCSAFVLFRKRKLARALVCIALGLTPFLVGLGTAHTLSAWKGVSIPVLHQN